MEEVINFLSFNGAEEYIENSKHINKYKTMQEGVMDILEKAIKHYGVENQMAQSIEELAELIVAINKCLRYKDDIEARNNLVEEVEDTLIMIDQLKIIMDIKDYELECYRQYKLERLERRIENEKKSN